MTINRVSLTSESIHTNTEAVVEVRYTQPPTVDDILDPPETPNKLIAYYDGVSDSVSLYIVNRSGLRLLPM